MSSHFKWYPSSEDSIVPWNARFAYPSQANKAEKMTPRIPPKNGAIFGPGSTIRLEFPAQGYVNPLNTTLSFDMTIYSAGTPGGSSVRVQNNIFSIFGRGRLMYGSTPLEDLINMCQIVRCLTEWTATNVQGILDQTSIAEGIGGYVLDCDSATNPNYGFVNSRQKFIQSTAGDRAAPTTPLNFTAGEKIGPAGDVVTGGMPGGSPDPGTRNVSTQRYQVNLPFGLMTQDKLIPTKFMASALAFELTLAEAASCLYVTTGASTLGGAVTYSGTPPTYSVGNVNLIPEVIQFDASYGNFLFDFFRCDFSERITREWSSTQDLYLAYKRWILW